MINKKTVFLSLLPFALALLLSSDAFPGHESHISIAFILTAVVSCCYAFHYKEEAFNIGLLPAFGCILYALVLVYEARDNLAESASEIAPVFFSFMCGVCFLLSNTPKGE